MPRRRAARAAIPHIVEGEEETLGEEKVRGHSRRSGERSEESAAKYDAADAAIKKAWGLSDIFHAFPKDMRPDTLGCTAMEYLKNISGRLELKEARPYFRKYAKEHKKGHITYHGLVQIMAELKAEDGGNPGAQGMEQEPTTGGKEVVVAAPQPTAVRQSKRGRKEEIATYTMAINKDGTPSVIVSIKTPKGFKLVEANVHPKDAIMPEGPVVANGPAVAERSIIPGGCVVTEEPVVAKEPVVAEKSTIAEGSIRMEERVVAKEAGIISGTVAVEKSTNLAPKNLVEVAKAALDRPRPLLFKTTVWPAVAKRPPPEDNEFDTRPIKSIRLSVETSPELKVISPASSSSTPTPQKTIEIAEHSPEFIGQSTSSLTPTPTPKKTVKIITPNPKNDSLIGLGASTHGQPISKPKWPKGSYAAKIEAAKEKSRKMREAHALLPKYGPMESYIRNLPENVADMFPSKQWLDGEFAEQNAEMAGELHGMFEDVYKYMQDETARICEAYRKV